MCEEIVFKSSPRWKPGSRVPGKNRDPVFNMAPGVRRDYDWIPAGVYPDENRGRNDVEKNRINFFTASGVREIRDFASFS
jgi:hypothetical protein